MDADSVARVKSVDELTEALRATGRKVTPQRQAIFRALAGSTVHPDAEAVYSLVRAELPTISLRTVYQTLNDLAAMGELSAIDVGTGSTRFDPNLEPHHHLVCERCGRIDDLHLDHLAVPVPADLPESFEVRSTEIVFRGRCASCAAGPIQPQPNQGGAPAHG